MGITGGTMVFISLIIFAIESQSTIETVLLFIAVVIALVLLIKFALWRIRTAKPNHSIYSADHQTGYQACSYDKSAVGKTGLVVTDLKPCGHVLVEGKQYQAISQNNYLVKGTVVLVIGGQEGSLFVKSKEAL